MANVCLTVLVGLPGVGKTTFCEKILKQKPHLNIVHICYDLYIKVDPELAFSYKSQRQRMLERIRKIVTTIKDENSNPILFQGALHNVKESCKYVILVDDNNFYQSMRYDLYKIARNLQISYAQIYFSLPLDLALSNNSRREQKISDDIIYKMNECLEIPSKRNNWESNTFVISSTEINFTEVYIFFEKSFHNEIELEKQQRVIVEQSHIHKIDLLLRKQVGKIVKNYAAENQEVSVLAKFLNDKRKQILSDVKNGVIDLQDQNSGHIINLIQN